MEVIGLRKKTIDEVRKILSSYECSLLSKEYINNRQKLDIECKCGNFFNKSLESMNRYKNICVILVLIKSQE